MQQDLFEAGSARRSRTLFLLTRLNQQLMKLKRELRLVNSYRPHQFRMTIRGRLTNRRTSTG